MNNPFVAATPVAKKLKILLYGPSGSGKTLAALSFPRVALIDAESGSDLYAGRPGVPAFHRVRCKTLTEMENAVTFIQQDAGKTFDTLVIDPISVLYDVEKNAQSANNTKDLGFREWAKINNRMSSLYTKLTSLNVHVVVIARESVDYAGEGNNLKKVGTKPDADKKLVYMMDFVLRINDDHAAKVEKSRGVSLGTNGNLPAVNWSVFEDVSKLYTVGEKLEYTSDEQAGENEADSLQSKENAVAFFGYWRAQSLTDSDILKALGLKDSIKEWTKGRAEADKTINRWIADQMVSSKPAMPKEPIPVQ